ncbi:MAG TPA: hypothetical protein VGK74_09920 [Symbiobacteriaceae bacterium]|jgi:hypothetical protein
MRSASSRRWVALGVTLIGVVLFVLSMNRTWWGIVMFAPQYPQGLTAISSLREMTGDVGELDELNHYIGMMKLGDAAALERGVAPYLVWGFGALALCAGLTSRWWLNLLLRIPLIGFPFGFLADLKFWLWYAGNHLDPKAALSQAVKAFTPVMLGEGKIAQFRTYGWVEPGFWLAVAGASLVLAGFVLTMRSRTREV